MTLINYNECGKEFSDKALICPNCVVSNIRSVKRVGGIRGRLYNARIFTYVN